MEVDFIKIYWILSELKFYDWGTHNYLVLDILIWPQYTGFLSQDTSKKHTNTPIKLTKQFENKTS